MPLSELLVKVIGSVFFQLTRRRLSGLGSGRRRASRRVPISKVRDYWSCDLNRAGRLVSLIALLGGVPVVSAADWEFLSTATVSELYSDNIRLSSDNSESDDLITELSASFGVRADGARIDLDFNYVISYFDYAQHNDLDDLRQTMKLASSVELVPTHLILDVDSAITQQLISSRLQGANSVVGSANVLDTFQNRVSARWNSQLGNFAQLEIGVGIDQVDYISGSAPGSTSSFQTDSTGSNSRFVLTNHDQRHRIFWSTTYTQNQVDYENNEQGGSENGAISIGYRWDSYSVSADTGWARYRHRVSVGGVQPDSDFNTVNLTWQPSYKSSFTLFSTIRNFDQGTIDPDAKRKSIGSRITWDPTVRTHLHLSTGNDFYGDSYSFGFSNKSRNGNWFADYTESITDLRQLLTGQAPAVIACPAGSLSPIDSGCHFEFVGSSNIAPTEVQFPVGIQSFSAINNDEFLNKHGVIGYTYNAARNDIGWTLFQTERIYLTDTRQEKDKGISLNWAWRMGRFSSLNLSVKRTEKLFSDGTEGDFVSSDLNFTREIGRKSDFSMTIHLAENVDRTANNNYSENHIRFQLTTSLK